MPSIIDVEGIGPAYKKKLKTIGIATTEALLEAGGTPKGRKELAEKTVEKTKTAIKEIMESQSIYETKQDGLCPECGSSLEFSGGCNLCKNCGWSKCS